MKSITIMILGLFLLLLPIGGCMNDAEKISATEEITKSDLLGDQFVIVEGGGEFPEELAGRWQGPSGWVFVFDKEGRIISSVISMARVEVIPGQESTFTTQDDREGSGEGIGRYVPGDWVVIYRPYDRTLYVRAYMSYLYQDMGANFIEGKQDNVFEGQVSEDWQEWQVKWYLYSEIFGLAPELFDFSNKDDEAYKGEFSFIKVGSE